jgi:hypothetical protein
MRGKSKAGNPGSQDTAVTKWPAGNPGMQERARLVIPAVNGFQGIFSVFFYILAALKTIIPSEWQLSQELRWQSG